MTNYVGVHPEIRLAAAAWVFDGKKIWAQDGSSIDVPSGTDPLEPVKLTHPGWTFEELKLGPGEYHPRMARTTTSRLKESPGINPENENNRIVIETIRGQLVALKQQLEQIFRTVHPDPENFLSYGHDIRNVLILAATEVEAHWKGILKANGVDGRTTSDYVKLLSAMKLNEYAIRLPHYPRIASIQPFLRWNAAAPTQSIDWYDAYNGVKHDRENEFRRGTLGHAIEAVCACAIMTFAQFGMSGFHYREEINSFFQLGQAPSWALADLYSFEHKTLLRPVPYPF